MGKDSSSAVAAPEFGRADKINRYLQRTRRARELAVKYPFAAESLAYYERVLELQAALADCLRSHGAGNSFGASPFLTRVIACGARDLLLSFAPPLAQIASVAGPARLAQAAGKIGWAQLLDGFWAHREASSPEERFFALALLQPYAECLAEEAHPRPNNGTLNCPVCATEPVAGVLRPEGFGVRRSLLCALCAWEWDFVRATCPGCDESRPESLGVYTGEQFGHVRVEVCDTCKRYLKTIDLTKNGLAVPVVDELATIPLDLWAQENGYRKLCFNLLNM